MPIQKRYKKSAAITSTPISVPRLLNLRNAASYLDVKVWTVRQLVKQAQLPHVQILNKFYVDRHDLDKFIEQNKIGVAA
jgi:excisionase family DNA binding protein